MQHDEICMEDIRVVEQSILDEVAQFCDQHNLNYSLTYGTLLGAVRHSGFIPWDDDIDISMPREDYDRFMELWPDEKPADLVLDRCDLDPENRNVFSKVRKDHSTFLQSDYERGTAHHKGIFIDIFPADRLAPGAFSRWVQYVDFALTLLFNRGHTSGKHGIIKLGEKLLLRLVPTRKYFVISQHFARKSRKWNHQTATQYVFPVTIADCRRYYPVDLYDDLKKLPFNGKEYRSYRNPDAFLSARYGDYMKLPPEKDRIWKHPPLLVDLTRNYEELSPEEQFR